jgi:hypothetical protein
VSWPMLALLAIMLSAVRLGALESTSQNPYLEPLKPTSFSAQAIVVPVRKPGALGREHKQTLAVEIQVQFEDFLPRNMEPTLLIDGVPVDGGTRVVLTEDRMTVMGFLVKKPQLLKDGAALEVRMEDAPGTRAKVPGMLQRSNIRPLASQPARQADVPSLEEWFGRGK